MVTSLQFKKADVFFQFLVKTGPLQTMGSFNDCDSCFMTISKKVIKSKSGLLVIHFTTIMTYCNCHLQIIDLSQELPVLYPVGTINVQLGLICQAEIKEAVFVSWDMLIGNIFHWTLSFHERHVLCWSQTLFAHPAASVNIEKSNFVLRMSCNSKCVSQRKQDVKTLNYSENLCQIFWLHHILSVGGEILPC